ncbi:MAG: ABC transporter ATP-binding protein [Planctomycetes bacterium]|nr:ABC transporter ATP-binding protein [Planctomycetota bacterium]MCC7170417.1 ABC transporter ATP-binding protein [Planctomycetota bacterium]
MSALELLRVSRTFTAPITRRRVVAVDGLSCAVDGGEVLGLVGPNGSGKTTALRCALGLLRPTSGDVRVFGAPWSSASRASTGFAPERFALDGRRTGREALELFARLAGFSRSEAGARAGRALERFGLGDAADRKLVEYSKGMNRRVAIAAALLKDPRLLVLDEPFDGLDPLGNLLVRDEILARAREGVAVLVTSHAMHDLEAVASHLVILERGRELAAGTIDSVLGAAAVTRLVVSGGDATSLARWRAAIESDGGRVLAQRPERESLEDFFRRRFGSGGS